MFSTPLSLETNNFSYICATPLYTTARWTNEAQDQSSASMGPVKMGLLGVGRLRLRPHRTHQTSLAVPPPPRPLRITTQCVMVRRDGRVDKPPRKCPPLLRRRAFNCPQRAIGFARERLSYSAVMPGAEPGRGRVSGGVRGQAM